MLADDDQVIAARADLCRLLAACYYEPAAEFVEEKLFDAMVAAGESIDAEVGASVRRVAAAFAADDLQTQLIDYTRLFLGPEGALAQPYESIWLSGTNQLMQESTEDVAQLYAEGGFETAEDFHDLPDHIAAELEFLYALIFREAQARQQRDDAALANARALRQRLLDEHLSRWIVPFTDAMRAGAQTAFYRELAVLTARFIERERGLL